MKTLFIKSILAGIIATAIMSIELYIATLIGMPKMSPPDMLVEMMRVPLWLAWLMHFIIGITFALAYTFIFAPRTIIPNVCVKGAVFGFAAFVFAQIAIAGLEMIFPPAQMEGSMLQLVIGSIIGHVIFGIAVAKTVGLAVPKESTLEYS